ncbi:hypothetical protein OSB04_un000683 [Centaurea solstitialis]|uniref:DUF4371 domain-containing protein n=1 Tax=Centaurea solstitialis TaxID=347529 RepID=A0AA38SH83_9ASTR|nr:hypothetical protein OSB04_un000683 [Centaurea solstitialis]
MASIYVVCLYAFQAIAFRGHNERADSINRGSFLEMLKAIGHFSIEIKELLCSAPKHASYTSPLIEKEILNLISSKMRRMICEEIGGRRFCLLVDEARDQFHKEQMSIVLRFVNKDGFIIKRLFGLVHVPDTIAQTLKDDIYYLLSHYNLDVKSIRGQGYDGASNMRGQFKDAVPNMHLERSEVVKAVIVRTCKELKRDNDMIIRYDDNAAVVIDQEGNPKGTRVFGAIARELRHFVSRGTRARKEQSDHTIEHHYRVDIFYEAINCQLMELNHRFNDSSMELLRLSSTLDPKNAYYKQLSSISQLCQRLVRTRRETTFDLVYRVVSLILTLPVSTATTERSFSAMNIENKVAGQNGR